MKPTLAERRAHLLALELEYGQKKAANEYYRTHDGEADVFDVIAARFGKEIADAMRRAVADGCVRRPLRAELKRLYPDIDHERRAIARMERKLGPTLKRPDLNGNGWSLTDDTERNMTVLRLGNIEVTTQLVYALRAKRFSWLPEVGYRRERSDTAWEAGQAIGRMAEGGKGERPLETTDATDTD